MDAAIGRINGEALVLVGRLGKGDGPVDEIQVQIVGAQVPQGLVDSLLDVGGLVVRVPQFRGQEYV
jgi:protein-L-isoaspartate O-methyltransferase